MSGGGGEDSKNTIHVYFYITNGSMKYSKVLIFCKIDGEFNFLGMISGNHLQEITS